MTFSRFPSVEEMNSWPAPNYVNPETQRPLVLGVTVSMTLIVVFSVSCRFYSRTCIVSVIGSDDWTMLLASIVFVSQNIMMGISTLPRYQTGYHLWDIRPDLLSKSETSAQMSMAVQLLFTALTALMKSSVLRTYLRIFPSTTSKWFCWTMIAYTLTWNVAFSFVIIFQCNPVETYWKMYEYYSEAKCLNVHAIYYTNVAQNSLSDVLIFLWPAKELLTIQVSFRQRVTLICMFSIGIIISVIGFVRIWWTHVYLHSYDVFWHAAEGHILLSLESGLGIACSCLPGCKPLLSKLMPCVFGRFQCSIQSRGRPTKVSRIPLSSDSIDKNITSSPSRSLKSGAEAVIVERVDFDTHFEIIRKLKPMKKETRVSVQTWQSSGEHVKGIGDSVLP